MIIKPIFFVFLCYSLLLNISWAAPHSHPDFQSTRDDIELKSTATATWLAFIEVYDAALYAQPDAQAENVLNGNGPFSLEILYKVSLSKSQLIEGADVALGRQHSEQQRASYQSDVDALHAFYQNVTEGDRFRLDITPTDGLSLFFNDQLVYQNTSIDFARYYVGLWLAENPLSDRVRLGLLDW
jgi:hypothetical protein